MADFQYDILNRLRLKAVARQLGELNEQVVYVGGATASLYVNRAVAPEVRPTTDIDVVIELASYADYALLDETLRKKGFQNEQSAGVICRYTMPGIQLDIMQHLVVDIMPTRPEILGFSNRWYVEGFKNSVLYPLDADTSIHIFTLPYFIASKLEAIAGRGGSDLRSSSDFEDIVFVLDGCYDFLKEMESADKEVQLYLRDKFKELLKRPPIEEEIYGHLPPRFATVRMTRIVELMRIASKSEE
jgi:predicted nucleotidyltransferase